MKIVVSVHAANCEHALGFVRAALAAGHEIPIVFFYHDAVHVGAVGADNAHTDGWLGLRQRHRLRLAVCVGAASRRGLLDESGARNDRCQIHEHFEIAGLGQLIGSMAESDRLVTFAG